MTRIKNLSIYHGLVDVNGHLILKNVAEQDIDAGLVKGPKGDQGIQGIQGLKGDKGDQGLQGIQGIKGDKGDQGLQGIQGIQGVKGDNGYYSISGSGGTRTYVRLASINGNGTNGGAYITMLLSGLGDYGDSDKATVLIHFAQRGDNSVNVRAWGWGIEALSSNYLTLYTKQISTWTFELWGLFANYTFNEGMTVLSQSAGQSGQSMIYNDSRTTTAPTGLSSAYTIDPAVPDDNDTGWTDITSSITWQSGCSYIADSGNWAGLRARRIGSTTQLILANVRIPSGAFTVGTNGNIANTKLLSGVPSQFRPTPGTLGSLSITAAGPLGTAYIDDTGMVTLGAIAPGTSTSGVNDVGIVGNYFN